MSESKFRAVGAPVLSKLGTYFSNSKVNGIDYYVDDPIGQINRVKMKFFHLTSTSRCLSDFGWHSIGSGYWCRCWCIPSQYRMGLGL